LIIFQDLVFAIEERRGMAFDIVEALHDAVASIIATLVRDTIISTLSSSLITLKQFNFY